jgi:malate/lactate dehydrogenase
LPHLVGGQGALASIPLPLATHEQEALHRSVTILRDAIESLSE